MRRHFFKYIFLVAFYLQKSCKSFYIFPYHQYFTLELFMICHKWINFYKLLLTLFYSDFLRFYLMLFSCFSIPYSVPSLTSPKAPASVTIRLLKFKFQYICPLFLKILYILKYFYFMCASLRDGLYTPTQTQNPKTSKV